MPARPPGPLGAPPMPARPPGARCPVPAAAAAAAAARAAAGSGPRAPRAHIRGRRRSLARSLAPRPPRRPPTGRAAAPRRAAPRGPGPARAVPARPARPGGRRLGLGVPPPAARRPPPAGPAGARGLSALRPRLPLNPVRAAACAWRLPRRGRAGPASRGPGCGLTAPPLHFRGAGARGAGSGGAGTPRSGSRAGPGSGERVLRTPGGGPAPWGRRCLRAAVAAGGGLGPAGSPPPALPAPLWLPVAAGGWAALLPRDHPPPPVQPATPRLGVVRPNSPVHSFPYGDAV
ncbi:unnamed protein product [Nyctereutes procyonoides]|uniref:(raccoon dog) hypothetical protein n=1 Tax=Nyctereutes procyonoides TaxID=34880 RepID=A0A811Z916_NYCPR|nr:unnamed protein product [Nyctereutes procyonoides]